MGNGSGLPTNPPAAAGAAEYQRLQAAGFTGPELSAWSAQQSQNLRNAGFTENEIAKHWGTNDPHAPGLHDMVEQNLGHADDAIKNDPTAAFAAGFGMSVAGLVINHKKPDQVLAQDAGLLDRVAQGAGQFVGDFPAAVAGFVGGGLAGAGAGSSVAPGPGTAIGGLVGAGAGAAALPEAGRQALLDAYEVRDGNVRTWQDALQLVGGSVVAVGKQALIGGVTAPIGGAVGSKVLAAGARPVIAAGADAVTQAVTATAIGGAMDGHVPDKADFASGAILALGFHAAAATAGGVKAGYTKAKADRVQANLEEIYRQTGMTPWEAATRAKSDPTFRAELLSQDVDGNPVTPAFRSAAPREPAPLLPAQPVESARPPTVSAAPPKAAPGPATVDLWTMSKAELEALAKNGPREMEVDEGPATREQAQAMLREHQDYGSYDDATLIDIIRRRTVEQKRPGWIREVQDGRAIDPDQQAAYVQMTGAIQALQDRGYNMNELPNAMLANLKERGWNPADAKEVLGARLEAIKAQRGAAEEVSRPPQLALPAPTPKPVLRAGSFQEAKTMLIGLEGSAAHAKAHGIKESDVISPAGAIGKFQIMPGTARQYGFDPEKLFDPAYNERVADAIIGDLHRRYHGDMAAIAIAYNAGPGRANTYLKQGPGTRLKATPDKNARGGVRYEAEPAAKNEAFLPLETQKYLANARRRAGGTLAEAATGPARKFPSVLQEGPAAPAEGTPSRAEGPAKPAEAAPDPALVTAWKDEGADARIKEIMSNIGEEPRPASLTNPDTLMNQFISELTPARNIDTRLIKGGSYDRNRDMGLEDIARQTYASDSRAGAFVRFGAVDPKTHEIVPDSPSIVSATKAAVEDGGTYDGWLAWMLAQRTVDKAAQGVKTGFNQATAFAHVADKAEAAKYTRASDLFNRVMDSALDYSLGAGVHSAKQVAKMKELNPTYIAMRRVMGDDASFNPANGRSFKAGDALRKMEGSDRQVIDPVTATIDNIRLIVKMADRNRVAEHVVRLAETGKLADAGLKREVIDDAQAIADGAKALKPYGIEATPENLEALLPALAERANAKLAPNQFLFFRNGVAEKWSTRDPALAELIRKSDSPGQMNVVLKAFETAAKFQRASIVSVPDFPVRNLLRDQVAAFVLDPLHPAPFLTAISGVMDVIGQTRTYENFVSQGGMGTTLAEMDADWMARDVHKVFEATGTYNGVANAVRHPLEFMQIVSERFEAASRVGYYKLALKKGIEPIKAATMSRKAYLDFAERGTLSVVNTMARVTPFFRPALLGLKQVGEALAERPFATPAYAIAAVTLPAVALYALNYFADQVLDEDEKFANHPRWEKDSFYITPPIGGIRFKLRFPQGVGMMFGGMVNRVLDGLVEHDPRAFEGWAKGFLNDYMPPSIPTLIRPAAEVALDQNFFSGKSLIPASLEGASGYMQYTPATSETGKALSRALGAPGLDIADFSPIQFDQLVKGYGGTVGQLMLKALDVPYQSEKKPYELADVPFVSSFVTRNPHLSAEPIQDFYDEMGKLETHKKDFDLAMRRAEGGADVTADIELSAPASQYAEAIAPVKDVLQTMSTAIQAINANKEMTADEKRQATDQLYNDMIGTAKQGLGVIDSLKAPEETAGPTTVPAPANTGPAVAPAAEAAPEPLPGANAGQMPLS